MITKTKTPEESKQTLAIETPERLSQNFLSFSLEDKYFLAVAGIITYTASQMYGRIVALGFLGVMCVLLCRPEDGRIYYIFWQFWHSLWIKKIRKGVRWQAVSSPSRLARLRRNRAGPRDEGYLPFNTGVIGNHLGFVAFGNTDVIVIEGTGSDLIAQSPEDQYRTSLRMADLTKRIASSVQGFRIAVSYVYRRRPPDVYEIADNFGEILHPNAAVPEALLLLAQGIPEEEWTDEQRADYMLYRVWIESLQEMERVSGDPTMAVVISIERDAKLIPAVKGKGSLSEEDLSRLTISRVAQTAIDGLKGCGVSDPRALDLEDLNLFVRGAWDVADLDSYHSWMRKDWETPEELALSGLHWPQKKILAFEDHCVVDETFHAVLRVRETPPRVTYDYFRQLHAAKVPWLTVSLVGETVSYKGEYRIVSKVIGAKDTFDDLRGVVRKAPHTRKRELERAKREEDLFNSRFAQAYCILVAVSAESKRQLDDGIDEAVRTIHQVGMSATRISGESRQLPALWSVTTGIPML